MFSWDEFSVELWFNTWVIVGVDHVLLSRSSYCSLSPFIKLLCRYWTLGPPTSTLEPYRTTHTIDIQTDEVSQSKDEWTTTDMPAELQYTWKGTTTFTLKDEIESTLEDVVAPPPPPEHQESLQEARRARGRPQPTQPTKQEMDEHSLTHTPYRSWCPICVRAKGKQDAYKQQQSKQPAIQA